MTQWTPAEIARYEQMVADQNLDIDTLVKVLRRITAERGEMQAFADVGAMLGLRDKDDLLGVALVAVQRISNLEERGSGTEPEAGR